MKRIIVICLCFIIGVFMVGYGDNGNGTYYLDSGKMQENLEKAIEDAEIEIMNAKTVVCRAAEREYHTSGIYTYYIVEEQKKEISICAISSTDKKVVIPSELDGYKVRALGYESFAHDNYEGAREIGGGIEQHLEELVIPNSVRRVEALAFYKCKKLSKVTLPENITLGYASFGECNNWKDIVLPYHTTCEEGALPHCGTDTLHISNSITGENIFYGDINKMILTVKQDTVFSLATPWLSAKVKELFSPKDATMLIFNSNDGNNRVEKLYINGKNTKVKANDSGEYADLGKVTMDEIYTVKNAKVISFAKKEKIAYHVKDATKVKRITCKKKANKYLYTWKKAKTTIRTFRYDKKIKKWKKSAKEVPKTYLIYAKKNGKYQQIATTKAKKIVTKYKNIKISPMSEWKAE